MFKHLTLRNIAVGILIIALRSVLINYILPTYNLHVIDLNLYFFEIKFDIYDYLTKDLFAGLLSVVAGLSVKGFIEELINTIFLPS